MNNKLKQICDKYKLIILNEDGAEKKFSEVLFQIYLLFSKKELLNFFNDILTTEIEQKIDLFKE